MTILALEFSSEQRSVAIVRNGEVCSEAIETGGRGVAAFALIERVLEMAKMEREAIQGIAVGLGPGSYTGIRGGIALAEGWKLANDVRLIGVSSVEAIVMVAQAEKIFGRANVVVNAQRDEFYCATYDIPETEVNEIVPLKILPRAEVELAGRDCLLIGPEAPKFFAGSRAVFPQAAAVGKIAQNRINLPPEEQLEPIYLRETSFVKVKR